MVPYYDAWTSGQHAESAQCIDCHVEPGLPARFAHKFVALGEVASHFSGDTSFPRATPPDVPDSRCLRCHDELPKETDGGFSHEIHAEKGSCATCHSATGHDVTVEALKAAGIFNASAESTTKPGQFATVDGGAANIEGHVQVPCSRCHDMAKTGCPRCHKTDSAKHPWTGDCTECHKAGEKFAFTHPGAGDCERCHALGDKHFKPASGKLPACKTCHTATSGDVEVQSPEQPRRLHRLPHGTGEALRGAVLGVPPPDRSYVEVQAPGARRALLEGSTVRDVPSQLLQRRVLHLPRRQCARRLRPRGRCAVPSL